MGSVGDGGDVAAGEAVGGLAQVGAEGFVVFAEFGLFLDTDGFAYGDAHRFLAFLEQLAGQTGGAQQDAVMAQPVEEPGIGAVEINRNHGHLRFHYDLQDGRLPRTVDDDALLVGLADGAGGEESYGFACFKHRQRLADSVD